MHDGILIGIGTALNDNPQLNSLYLDLPIQLTLTHASLARHLPPSEKQHPCPRPIILDTLCRLPVSSKLVQNHIHGRGRKPMVICGDMDMAERITRKMDLEALGVEVVEIPLDLKTSRYPRYALYRYTG
jgi:2,5-diamino-6-(ribosylamino)-4(3H)-pyrimidinone 5'-phosphate reductase